MTDNYTRASRKDFSALYSILYDSIDTHIKNSQVKLRGWDIWQKWKSQGLRKRMTSYSTVSRIIYGSYINLDVLLKFLFDQFSFLPTYLNYHVDTMDSHVVHFCHKLKSGESQNENEKMVAKKVVTD